MRHRSRRVLVATAVAILCLFAGLLISNFVGGETKIERRIERLYTLDDPRFMSYADWQVRPAREKSGEWLASLIGTQL